MNIEVLADADAVAGKAARNPLARRPVTPSPRGRFAMALSAVVILPGKCYAALADERVPWGRSTWSK